jgi:hypothetical protein
MRLFQIGSLVLFALTFSKVFGQAKGNYNYLNEVTSSRVHHARPAPSLAEVNAPHFHEFTIRGLYNCKAQNYLAIFTITQVGKDQRETEQLVRAKTDSIQAALQRLGLKAEMYVDMISFMPIYEVEVTKKLFSKNTYNEIPKGFELKKNLHFRYSDPRVLDELVTQCARQEIYDLVRVDYFLDDLEAKKAKMVALAEEQLKGKMNRFKRLLNTNFEDLDRRLAEGFNTTYPIEQYQTYLAYCSNTLNSVTVNGTVTPAPKTTSQFYQPKPAKGYDFVLNPTILEPVVQIEYELKLVLQPKPQQPEPKPKEKVVTKIEKQLFWVTPNGDVKQLAF